MLVWLSVSRNTILGLYSVSITGFLIFMYAATAGYEPEEDSGFRPEITVVIPAKNEGEVIESVPYRMMFVFISLFVTLTVMLYGTLTPWKGGWLTRADTVPQASAKAYPETAPLETVAQ